MKPASGKKPESLKKQSTYYLGFFGAYKKFVRRKPPWHWEFAEGQLKNYFDSIVSKGNKSKGNGLEGVRNILNSKKFDLPNLHFSKRIKWSEPHLLYTKLSDYLL